MKISEMTCDQLSRCLCMIAEPMETLSNDAAFVGKAQEYFMHNSTNQPVFKLVLSFFGTFVPLLLRDHKDEMYLIAAGLTGETSEKIARRNALSVIMEIRNSIDKDLIDFFTSLMQPVHAE